MDDLVKFVLKGSRRALARLLTRVENGSEDAQSALAVLYPYTGHAHILGITGAPGAGKSTLASALAKAYRAQGKTVAILAVDPTSPFTGGAILGDRIRMRDLSGDPGVFIRSMATRGSLGGLAHSTRDVARVLDAAGFDVILVETVGAGQSEVEIARAAHTTLVVEAPGMGDDVQAIKAGILEIADVLVVNKADRPGADNTVRYLRAMLELGHPARTVQTSHHGRLLSIDGSDVPVENSASFWMPPVVAAVAADGTGLPELLAAVESHRRFLADGAAGERERERLKAELIDRLREVLISRWMRVLPESALTEMIARVQARSLDPNQAVQSLLAMGEQTISGIYPDAIDNAR